MSKTLKKIKLFFQKIRGYFPSRVPQGLAEFESWSKSIAELYDTPGSERDARFTLSSFLMRLNPEESHKSKYSFAKALYRAAASQVGVYIQEEIKMNQRQEIAAIQKKAQEEYAASQAALNPVEVTTLTSETSNDETTKT